MSEIQRLQTADDLQRAIAESAERPVLILKHSLTCSVSSVALREFERFAEAAGAEGAALAVIEIQRARDVSRALAEQSGVRHESPQVILLRDGAVRWNASHWSITAASLSAAMTTGETSPAGSSSSSGAVGAVVLLLALTAAFAGCGPGRPEVVGEVAPESFRVAAESGDLEAVREHLDAGLPGEGVLLAATRAGKPGVVKMLIDAGVDVGGVRGSRALVLAARGCEECWELLEAAGASPTGAEPSGVNVLIVAAGSMPRRAVRRCLEAGLDPNAATRTGRTALMAAIEGDREPNVRLLLRHGADVDQADRDGWTPVMLAARLGRTAHLQILLELTVDPNRVSDLGWTALMLASSAGHLPAVQGLLDAGADPHRVTWAGGSALRQARLWDHSAVVETLLGAGAGSQIPVVGSGG